MAKRSEQAFTVDKKTLTAVVKFYDSLTAADKAFLNCQDTAFRQYIKAALNARGMREAVDSISDILASE